MHSPCAFGVISVEAFFVLHDALYSSRVVPEFVALEGVFGSIGGTTGGWNCATV